MKTVRHWLRGYQHDHIASNTTGALGVALRCAGQDASDRIIATMVAMLESEGYFEFVNPGKSVDMYRLVSRGRHAK